MKRKFHIIYSYQASDGLDGKRPIAKVGMTAPSKEFDSKKEAAKYRINQQFKKENPTQWDAIVENWDNHVEVYDLDELKPDCPWTGDKWTHESTLEMEKKVHDSLEMDYERVKRKSRGKDPELFRIYKDEEDWDADDGQEVRSFVAVNEDRVTPIVRRILKLEGERTYFPRPHQRWVTGKVYDEYTRDDELKIIPLFLAPRFGKTLNVLDIWNKLSHKICVVEAHMLSALTSFSNALSERWDISDDAMSIRVTPDNIDESIEAAQKALDNDLRVMFLISMHYSTKEKGRLIESSKSIIESKYDKIMEECAEAIEKIKAPFNNDDEIVIPSFPIEDIPLIITGEKEMAGDELTELMDGLISSACACSEDYENDPLVSLLSEIHEEFKTIIELRAMEDETEGSSDDYVDLTHLSKLSTFIQDNGGATVYVDEADHGAHTNRSRRVTSALLKSVENKTCVLLGTGTHIERATAPFGDSLTCLPITVTYADMLMAKQGDGFLFMDSFEGTGDKENEALGYIRAHKEAQIEQMKNYVTPQILFLKLPEEIVELLEKDDKTPSWKRLMEKGNSDCQVLFFQMLLQDGIGSIINLRRAFGLLRDNYEEQTKIKLEYDEDPFLTLMFFGGNAKTHTKNLKKSADTAVGNSYDTMIIDSSTTRNEDAELDVKARIRKAKQDGKLGLLIFSLGMGSRSFSVGEVNAVIEMYDGGDANVARQKQSRAMTPMTEKELGYIVCLSFDRYRRDDMLPLLMQDAAAVKKRGGVADMSEAIKKVYRTQLWFHIDAVGDIEYFDYEGDALISEVMNNQTVITKVLGSMCSPTLLMQDEGILEAAIKIASHVSKISAAQKARTDKILKSVKTFRKAEADEAANGEVAETEEGPDSTDQEVSEIVVKRAIERICRLPHVLSGVYPDNEDVTFMATLESVIEDDDYNKDLERLMGVPVDLIKKIVDALFAEEATMEFLEMAFTDSKRIRKQLVEE